MAISQLLDTSEMNPSRKGCMGATARVKEGTDLSQINHKPAGMGGLDAGLLRKSRFVPTSSNVTK